MPFIAKVGYEAVASWDGAAISRCTPVLFATVYAIIETVELHDTASTFLTELWALWWLVW